MRKLPLRIVVEALEKETQEKNTALQTELDVAEAELATAQAELAALETRVEIVEGLVP